MTGAHAYPPDLADYVVANWPAGVPLEISREALEEALTVCFVASMLREEERALRFRVLLADPLTLPEDGSPNRGVLRLSFLKKRVFEADELRRLSPSTPFETALIGAHVQDARLRIWGIAHSGPAWLAPSWGGRAPVPVWTTAPIIRVSGPGRMMVRTAGQLVGGLERGQLVSSPLDVFDSAWLPAAFSRVCEGVLESTTEMAVDQSLIQTVSHHMLRRAIQLIRGQGHGGMILFVDDDRSPNPEAIRLKYGFQADEPRRRYRTLLSRLIERLSLHSGKTSVGWLDFVTDEDPQLEVIERSIFELSRLVASLAAIDGAVLLNKHFDILGFGAEVSAELPAPEQVWRALDTEGLERRCDRAENVGTRHRAAYRFVQDHPRGLAVVVSQDGAVRFVADRDGLVTYWEQSVSP